MMTQARESADARTGSAPGRRPLLDARGAGTYTGLGERYIRRLRSERKIACIRIGGRLLFDPDDLDNLIERHREPTVDIAAGALPTPAADAGGDAHRAAV